MIKIDDIARRLSANAEAMRSLVQTISDEQAQWQPNPETWSMKQVMEHAYNEERIDFRKLQHDWNEKQAPPNSLMYAGGW